MLFGDHGTENRQARIAALPPTMKLLPRHWPDWRVNGARPTSAAICLRESQPSSGNSANSVREITGPTPGTDCDRVFCKCHTGEPLMQSSVLSTLLNALSKALSSRRILLATAAGMRCSLCRYAPIMAMIWRRLATRSASNCVTSSGMGRAMGWVNSAK